MAEAPRRTLKVASVVGRCSRRRSCRARTPELGPLDEVIVHLDTLRAADLVHLDRVAEQAYLFKHVATQEVAYESLPFATADDAPRPGRAVAGGGGTRRRSSSGSTCSRTTSG